MEVTSSISTKSPTKDQLECYRDLVKRGRPLSALEAAEQDHGPSNQWTDIDLLVLAIRCLWQQGRDRDSDALTYRIWRKYQGDARIIPYFLITLFSRRGPLKAWEEYQRLESDGFPGDADQQYLLCIKADILSAFRDFRAAEQAMAEALTLGKADWVLMRKAQLLHESDRHEEALSLAERIHRESPGSLNAARLYASFLQRDDQNQKALDLLLSYREQSQSMLLAFQTCQLAVEMRAFPEALESIRGAEALATGECPAYLRRGLNNAWADLYCSWGRYEEALPYLEQKSPYHASLKASISVRGEDHSRKILELPFVQQRHMTCAPASIASVLKFWGEDISQDEIAREICYNGTYTHDQRVWLNRRGWHVIEFDLNFPQLKQLIELGIPVLLSTVEPGNSHLQVIAGYDEATGTYILRDPMSPRLVEMLVKESEVYYASSGPRCMVAVPGGEAGRVSDLGLAASELYDGMYRFREALESHQHEKAADILAQLNTADSDHRITLNCKLEMAYHNRDDRRALACTEQLLEKYPEDVNFQLGKVQLLSNLGAASASLEFMEQLEAAGKADFLILSRLVDALRFDHRNQERVQQILEQLIKRRPLHPQTLYALAGVTWDSGNYARARDLYRFVTCLEDTTESYASSYFKAERFLQQTEAALDFLRDRVNRFGKKSSGPVISLFHALDALEKTNEGLEALWNGIEQRPEDGDLMLFTARRLLRLNRIEEASALAERAQPHINKIRHLEIVAEVAAHQLDREKAVSLWRQVLEAEPLNYDASHTLVQLLLEQDKYAEAIDYLDRKIGEFPGNYQLQKMRLNALAEDDVDRIEEGYRQLIQTHPDDNWAYIKLSHLCGQRFKLEEALEYASEATRISRRDAQAWTQLGRTYALSQQSADAQRAFKQAIELDCDCTQAYNPLLQTVHEVGQKKQLLKFIHDRLIHDVTFGDGILCYGDIAKQWLAPDELNAFLHSAMEQRPDLWQSWLALVSGYCEQGLLDKANDTIRLAIRRFPLVPRLHLELAEILRLQGNSAAAISTVEEVIALNPFWSQPYTRKADLLESDGRYDEAIEVLRRAIQRLPEDSVLYVYLADLLAKRERDQEAIEALVKSLQFSPFYGWAWEKLAALCGKTGQVSLIRERMQATRQSFPNNAVLAKLDAESRDALSERLEVLADFIRHHPRNVELVDLYARSLAEASRFREALEICSGEYWDHETPLDLRARHAWLINKQGNTRLAIEEIQKVTESAPHYYTGWWMLANWALDEEQKDLACDALEQCRRLRPNDANALTFVAESLQRAERSSEEITPVIQRAFTLAPSDSYIGLTYLDQLIEDELWEQAGEILNLVKLHNVDAFILTRELQIRAGAGAAPNILLSLWSTLLTSRDANDWVVHTGWQLLRDAGLTGDATSIVLERHNQGEPIHEHAGYCLAAEQIGTSGLGTFEKNIASFDQPDAFTQRMLECYLDRLVREERLPGRNRARLEHLISDHCDNWGTYGLLLCQKAHWHHARSWFSNWESFEEPSPWMLFLASMSFREAGSYEEGAAAMEAAYQLPADHYRGDIVCWHSLDQLLLKGECSGNDLEYIDRGNLTALAEYALRLCEALMVLGTNDFSSKYKDVSPKLRFAQQRYQSVCNNQAAKRAKKLAHRRIKASLQVDGLLRKLYWSWMISNHF